MTQKFNRFTPPIERFLDKICKTQNNCWIWTNRIKYSVSFGKKRIRNGKKIPYAFFKFKGKIVSAHRWSYEYYKKQIPKGLEIDHVCKNSLCVNPDHLEAVTKSENIKRSSLADVIRKNAMKITHCKKGHAYTPENTYIDKYKGWKTRRCKICKIKKEKDRREKLKSL